jgi:enamine deaminase RidA (YjgF/YER057c/UK114 family)
VIEKSVVVGTEKNATDVNNTAALSRSILTPKGWSWQEKHGFVQGRVLSPHSRTIYIAGQASVDDKGNPINKGNIEAQFVQALTNLEAVVAEAGGTLANVVKVTYFTTDIDRFFQGEKVLVKHLFDHNCYPTSTLVGVKSLFHPDILFEVEAIAVV